MFITLASHILSKSRDVEQRVYKTATGKTNFISAKLQFEGLTVEQKSPLDLLMEFNEIQSSSSSNESGSLNDSRYNFSSSDESFNSNSSQQFQKKNEVNENFDLLLSDDDNKNSGLSFNEMDTTSQQNHKSFGSLVKFLKRISAKKSSHQQPTQSILRRPTEYCFVKGMSGLSIRVAKASPSSTTACCHRVMKY